MKHYKAVQRTIDTQVLIEVTCDKCDSIIRESKGYDTREFTLEMLRGQSYPGSGYNEGWKVELCDACINWLLNILKESSVVLQKVENDW